ncbi:uncharacterized protein LOC131432150 [Malaya genurostris]|uniref:uncharacterized protein LOC131432150 n=1 Tax=Malaya genurostris TaxID=325434 RepID=UPI0026F40285|nr:uncharacterized protein LOC131432150 [Malaya genurostris]
MPPSYCSVAGCTNSRSPTCSLYCFPKDDAVCKQWVEFCNRPELWKKYDENGPEYLYKSSRICSDHFQPNDFNKPYLFSKVQPFTEKIWFVEGSVPTLYPASKEPKNRYSIGGGIGGLSGLGAVSAAGGGGGGSGNNSPPNSNNNSIDSESLITPMSAKRPLSSQPSTQQPVAKQRRSLPPALSASATTNNSHATVSGALAGLIQRQQLKEQQRKAFAANNNNNNSTKLAAAAAQEKLEDERGYGINYVDMDGGDSTEYDSGFQNSVEKELAAYKQLQQMKAVKAAAAVIPASLKCELTVTPAVSHLNTSSSAINNGTSSSHNNSNNTLNGSMNYKEKYEQTLKELFACRKIVKNQNNAIKQLQGEIDFLNQLLKEK